MAIGLTVPDTPVVLDNDIFTHWRNGQPYVLHEIAEYINRHKRPPALTTMTLFEAMYGIESSVAKGVISKEQAQEYQSKIEKLSQGCIILPFDQNAATTAAYIFARLSQSERNKHWRDLFTAATALAHRHGVATQNKKDFELIATHLPSNNPLLRLAIWKA